MTYTPLAKHSAETLARSTLMGCRSDADVRNLADGLGIDPSWDLGGLSEGEIALIVVCHIIANS